MEAERIRASSLDSKKLSEIVSLFDSRDQYLRIAVLPDFANSRFFFANSLSKTVPFLSAHEAASKTLELLL